LINGMNILMVTGKITDPENRKLMVRKMEDSKGVIELRIIRAKQVQDQFGPGLPSEQATDELDRKAMETKTPIFVTKETMAGGHQFRAVIPFIVSTNFRGTNCLSCHHVKEGSINGAASIVIDMSNDMARVAQIKRWVWAGDLTLAVILSMIVVWRRAQEKRERLLRELESANEELKNFAYVVSHDLKAPLRAIGSLADWLSTDYADKFDDEGKEHMRLLISRVRRMDGLIDGILLYSRVGRVKETIVAVDLNQLVREVIDLLAPPANITVTIENPLPTIMAEPTRIQQVFQNLLSNAVKYMDKAKGDIGIACSAEGKQWKFSVADNGPGIKQQHFEKIFQLFQTLAPRDRVESTGVGLALVKKIVEMYGGHVWVESIVGEGSTFFFTLPRTSVTPISTKGT
ncbi:MAG: sensor histidine kinase, partial [Gallionellaceae bacterium]